MSHPGLPFAMISRRFGVARVPNPTHFEPLAADASDGQRSAAVQGLLCLSVGGITIALPDQPDHVL